MKIGDKVEVTSVANEDEYYFKVGDTAKLTRQDDGGDWWADFDDRSWGEHVVGEDEDREFCLQAGFSKFKLKK